MPNQEQALINRLSEALLIAWETVRDYQSTIAGLRAQNNQLSQQLAEANKKENEAASAEPEDFPYESED